MQTVQPVLGQIRQIVHQVDHKTVLQAVLAPDQIQQVVPAVQVVQVLGRPVVAVEMMTHAYRTLATVELVIKAIPENEEIPVLILFLVPALIQVRAPILIPGLVLIQTPVLVRLPLQALVPVRVVLLARALVRPWITHVIALRHTTASTAKTQNLAQTVLVKTVEPAQPLPITSPTLALVPSVSQAPIVNHRTLAIHRPVRTAVTVRILPTFWTSVVLVRPTTLIKCVKLLFPVRRR